MPLNLIDDTWIPVLDSQGARHLIAPWQVADSSLDVPDWPRADLNLACYELLIGLLCLADPPADDAEWRARKAPDPERLRVALAPFAPAFELMGEGPRFLQDRGAEDGAESGPDMLFIDSAGASTAKNNADLMVRRQRYAALDLPLAAMALYTLQAFAPSGGAGNRTSMRGGGPLLSLVDPERGLWPMIWANVPNGAAGHVEDLPWMKGPRTSEKGKPGTFPQDGSEVEAFFGQPRRLWLMGSEEEVTRVRQKPWGTNYGLWEHPLTPYYRQKAGEEWLPRHPASGRITYRNWAGIVFDAEDTAIRRRAACLRRYETRMPDEIARVLLGGWSMDNMSPRDFLWSSAPLFPLGEVAAILAETLVFAASETAVALRRALEPVLPAGTVRDARIEAFWQSTEADFERVLEQVSAASDASGAVATDDWTALAEAWLDRLGQVALRLFEAEALPALTPAKPERQGEIVAAHRMLRNFLSGRTPAGGKVRDRLGLPKPEPRRRSAA